MITFTPISEPYQSGQGPSGGGEVESPKALAYLAEVDEVKILVDCGSPESFDFGAEREATFADILRSLAPSIDLVLLCHSTLSHLGLYAYARANWGLVAPCYATLPVATMGRLTTLEAVQSLNGEMDVAKSASERQYIPTAEQVDTAFDDIVTLRYSQPTQLEGKCAGLTLTAYGAGHTLGGAIWKLRSPSSGTLLIALDWNHTRERHIDGTALVATASTPSSIPGGPSGVVGEGGGVMEAVRRPDLLITSISRATHINARRKDRDAALVDVIHNTIRSGRSVLMPVDASARLLELLVLLDQHWAYAYPTARFPLCLVSATGREVIERARTLMEWMTKQWATKGKEGDDNTDDRANKGRKAGGSGGRGGQAAHQAPSSPLDFKYLRIFSSMKAMDDVLAQSDAKLVLAWPPSMAYGPSRKLFARMASSERDVVLLTSMGEPGTLTRWLWNHWEGGQDQGDKWGRGKVGKPVDVRDEVEVEIKSKVLLEGDELQAHLDAQRIAKEKAEQQRALLARSHRRLEADEEDVDSDDSDSEGESIDDGEGGGDGQQKVLSSSKMLNGDVMGGAGDGEGGAGGDELSFDIYLKGNAQRATSFFGSSGASGGLQRFRMFPLVEKRKRVDAYGETLDVGRWLSRRRELEAEAKVNGDGANLNPEAAAAAAKRRKMQEDKEARERREQEEKPSKFVSETRTIHVSCKVSFVDMDGLGDGRALKELLPRLHPRRLVLVGGDQNERLEMTKSMQGMTKDLFAPIQGERVQIGEFTASFTVHLGEGLLAGLDLSSFDDYQIARLKARVRYGAESNVPTLELDSSSNLAVETADNEHEGEASSSANGAETTGPEATKTLFIGDLRLSSLKAALARTHRMPSEFAGEGTLVCGADAFGGSSSKQAQDSGEGGAVRVQKSGEGQIIIEGNVGKGFYKVRNAVYDLHAKVDG